MTEPTQLISFKGDLLKKNMKTSWKVIQKSSCFPGDGQLSGSLCASPFLEFFASFRSLVVFFRQAFSVRVLASAPWFVWGLECHDTHSDLNPHCILYL